MSDSEKDVSAEEKDLRKLRILLPHWVEHNEQHGLDYKRWLQRAEELGLESVASELRQAIDLVDSANEHLELAAELSLERRVSPAIQSRPTPGQTSSAGKEQIPSIDIQYRSIGVIRSPYKDQAPYQPVAGDSGDFRISLQERFAPALSRLGEFEYIYVLYHIHLADEDPPMIMTPSWAGGVEVGMFASRSPLRPNRIGLSIVKVKKIEGAEIWTSGLDAFDQTPVLDIKPYIKDLDSKDDANYGWITGLDDYEHLLLHIKGIPHDY